MLKLSDNLIGLKVNNRLLKYVVDWQLNRSKKRVAKTKQRNEIRGSTKKIVADFLNIKPVMTIKNDGSLGPTGVIWGQKNTIKKINKFIGKKLNPSKEYDLAIGHSACEENAELLRKVLYESYSNIKSISILENGCALGVHTGPGTLAVCIQEHLSI